MDESLEPGQVIAGKLEVVRKIGGGGMGAVYEVEHLLTKHRRALKVVSGKHARSTHVERLLREATVASRLDTPHVVDTLDVGELDDGSPYVLMELLDGMSLIDLIQLHAPLDVLHMLDIAMQVCDGMAAAHAAGIIHRDLKPENVFLVHDRNGKEVVKIIDFGISHFRVLEKDEAPSRLTAEGMVIGTPFYMSPEQAGGAPVDERTDVYALGVMLYEGLTGKLPFDAETTGALFMKIGTGEFLPLKHRRRDLAPGLAAVVERAFHRKPRERFASMVELKEALSPFFEAATAGGHATMRETASYGASRPLLATEQGLGIPVLPSLAAESAAASRPPRPEWRRSQPNAPTEEVEVDRAFALGAPVTPGTPVAPNPSSETAPMSEVPSTPPRRDSDPFVLDVPAPAPAASRSSVGRVALVIGAFGIALVLTVLILSSSEDNKAGGSSVETESVAARPEERRAETRAETTASMSVSAESEGETVVEEHGAPLEESSAEEEIARPDSRGPRRGMMRHALTPAERANLETNPYHR